MFYNESFICFCFYPLTNQVDHARVGAAAHQKVIGLDVAVDQVLFVALSHSLQLF